MSNKANELTTLHEFFTCLANGDYVGASTRYLGPVPLPMATSSVTSSHRTRLPPTSGMSTDIPAIRGADYTGVEASTMDGLEIDVSGFSKMVQDLLEDSRGKYQPLDQELKGRMEEEERVRVLPVEVTEMDVRALKGRCTRASLSRSKELEDDWVYKAANTSFEGAGCISRSTFNSSAPESSSGEEEVRTPSSSGSPELARVTLKTNGELEWPVNVSSQASKRHL